VGPFPKVGDAPTTVIGAAATAKAKKLGRNREDYCLGEHTNGVHAIRVTNLHTHGLHVRPGRNPDGTHSDNVILRVLSQADFKRREQEGAKESCRFLRDPEELYFLRDDEVTGEADYEFRLGDVQRRMREHENRRRQRNGRPLLPPQPHPAGTFWYHPHSHGATHNQVASGMAGFLLVEGDIEDAINRVLVKWNDTEPIPDPSLKNGPYDYRERLMLMQRVLNLSEDKDASKKSPELRTASNFTVLTNGGSTPTIIQMRPGAVERWRVLNGSVDGRGYKRFMCVKGQYTVQNVNGALETLEVRPDGKLSGPVQLEALERRKQGLWQLSVDGVTLVKEHADGEAKYYIKNLSKQGIEEGASGNSPDDMKPNPLWEPDKRCMDKLEPWIKKNGEAAEQGAELFCKLVKVWRDPESVRNCWVRWREFYMGPANRTDVFFQAPRDLGRRCVTQDSAGKDKTVRYEVYTVFAKTVAVHADTPQYVAQNKILGRSPGAPSPEDVVIAWVLVQEGAGEPIPNHGLDEIMRELEKNLPPVQEYLKPVRDEEIKVHDEEEVKARRNDSMPVKPGDYRTRRVLYSGWGHPSMPLVSTYPTDPSAEDFDRFVKQDQSQNDGKLENLIYAEYPENSGYYVLLAPNIRTMAIGFDNPRTKEEREKAAPSVRDTMPFHHPHLPRKFDPTDPYRARMLENTAEEWALYNLTNTQWGNTTDAQKSVDDPIEGNNDPTQPDYKQPPTQYTSHYVGYPIDRRTGEKLFLENPYFQAVSRGIDHPFHVHQNPFWVSRIEIPDETGKLVNILDEPRWMDSIWIPRNGGRVVFRMRFPDYVGAYVHHCHILLHEDNGMMHVIEATPFADESNYYPATADGELNPEDDAKRPSPAEAYRKSYTFFDPDEGTGQLYPGFEVTAPKLE
jgi:hypothetical protein